MPVAVAARDTEASIAGLELRSGNAELNIAIGDEIIDGKLEETMQGATELKLEILDRDYQGLNSGVFETRVTALLDGVTFCLTEVNVIDIDTLELKFEHRLIAQMRKTFSYRTVQRSTMTRAEFIASMLSESLGKLPYKFICPALAKIQPVRGTESGETEAAAPHSMIAAGLKIEGKVATEEQLNQAALLLRACQATQAPEIVETAIICAGIGESRLRALTTPNSLGFWGVLQGSSGKNPSYPAYWPDPKASEEMGRYFCTGGKGFQGGGAIRLANMGVTEPGQIATTVEASGEPAEYYGKYEEEAKAIVRAYHAGGGSFDGKTVPTGTGSFAGTGATAAKQDVIKTARYEFSRGKPGETEDTYTCAQRLAGEVNWHFFVVGVDEIYFVEDDELIKAKPQYRIYSGADPKYPQTPGVEKFTCDIEVGARSVIRKNKRQPKVSEAQLDVRVDLFSAQPGMVIGTGGWGPADKDWLIESVERDLYLPEATLHLRSAQKAVEEAPATLQNVAGVLEGQGGGLPGAVAVAKRAYAQRQNYIYKQVRPIPASLFPDKYPVITDCSGFATLVYKETGLPDPNGLNYDGQGNTATLIAHARKINNPVPGCMLFFGSDSADPEHVVIYIGDQNGIGMEAPGVNLREGNAIGLGEGAGPFIGYYLPLGA